MSYEFVKEVLNKVRIIVDKLDKSSTEEDIQRVIKAELTASEYDTYIKYCEFYKSRKDKEFRESVLSLGSQIDVISKLYDERQELLRKKSMLSQERDDLRRNIISLPWIRLKLEYGHLENEHDEFLSSSIKGIMADTEVRDEIKRIEGSNFIVRVKNKKRLEDLRKQSISINHATKSNGKVLAIRVQNRIDYYLDVMKNILVEALKNPLLRKNAIKAVRRIDGEEIDSLTGDLLVGKIVDVFMQYTVTEESKSEESIRSCIEEDLYPPVGKLHAIDADKYMDYLIKFLCGPIDIEMDRCMVDVGRIMQQIRTQLDKQRECIESIYDSNDRMIVSSSTATNEEKDIFALVYRENKK